MKSFFEKLNTFNKGHWLWFPSKKLSPDSFIENCNKICGLFNGTEVCLKEMKYTSKYLSMYCFFVFVDNSNTPQIVGNISRMTLKNLRGICDGYEQNINPYYIDVANEFLNNCKDVLFDYLPWQKQINWYARLKKYECLFKAKEYNKINIEQLIDDLAYNGYSLHYNQSAGKDKKYYLVVKRNILKEPMLKPLIAKYLGCKTDEIYVGKYSGNGKDKKYIIGFLLSKYLHKDCKIEKVFGSIDISDYSGDFLGLDEIETTGNFKVVGWAKDDIFVDLFEKYEVISTDDDFNQINR